jgi:hypothetical protein
MRLGLARLVRPELWRRLQREVWHRRLPHGLISWRYLWPGNDPRLRLHRRLWWQSGARWPRPLWLAVELWLWSRWVLWGAWRSSWRVLRHPERDRNTGEPRIGRAKRAFTVLRLALGWCIPPGASSAFGLDRQPRRALDYVYDHELPAYHLWRSTARAATGETTELQAAAALLHDKLALAETLPALRIPVVRTRNTIPKHARPAPLDSLLTGTECHFCKTRGGNQGRGAFAVWRTAAGLAGQAFSGESLADTTAVETAWRKLCALDDVLLQPCLRNHRLLAPLAEGDAAITVRYISAWRHARPVCLSAVLEVPAGQDEKSGRTRYVILPIEAETGRLHPWPAHRPLPAAARTRSAQLRARVPDPFELPDWHALADASGRAQAQFPAIWAIAWDWVLTPSGPVLLEGNVGWGTAVPQQLHGGLLGGNDGDDGEPGPGTHAGRATTPSDSSSSLNLARSRRLRQH